jgi:divalent metal cation (Fe/Co/Zn/Cd) transporter
MRGRYPERMATRATHLRRGLFLSALSIAWNGVVGSGAIFAAAASGSLSLLGFGVDAVIDSIASVALVWRFVIESRQPVRAASVEHIAERLVGLALVAFAIYLALGSVGSLAAHARPEPSFASLVLLVASVVVLPPLAIAKNRVAAELGSGALRLDSILNAVAALIVSVILVREGWQSLRAARSDDGDSPTGSATSP